MIDYIGDISKADAEALSRWATNAKNILEFGCGASTQVMAEATKGKITSIDTEPAWIAKTEAHLERQGNRDKVTFHPWGLVPTGERSPEYYDFIFDDGVDHLRRVFGIQAWRELKVGGWLALHDQRRKADFDNSLAIINEFFTEVGTVHFNHAHSNITFIQKKVNEPWSNWQIDENIDMSKW